MTAKQLELIDASETAAKFDAYHERNPHIYERFKEFVFALERAGQKRVAVSLVFELIRYARVKPNGDITFRHSAPLFFIDPTSGDSISTTDGRVDIKLGNSYQPYYERKFIADFPDKAHLFRKRRAKADADG